MQESTSKWTSNVGRDRLNQAELADRWRLSSRTLERWRWRKQGPNYIKLGGRVVYRIEDVEAFEAAQLRGSTRP